MVWIPPTPRVYLIRSSMLMITNCDCTVTNQPNVEQRGTRAKKPGYTYIITMYVQYSTCCSWIHHGFTVEANSDAGHHEKIHTYIHMNPSSGAKMLGEIDGCMLYIRNLDGNRTGGDMYIDGI